VRCKISSLWSKALRRYTKQSPNALAFLLNPELFRQDSRSPTIGTSTLRYVEICRTTFDIDESEMLCLACIEWMFHPWPVLHLRHMLTFLFYHSSTLPRKQRNSLNERRKRTATAKPKRLPNCTCESSRFPIFSLDRAV
jgi:hypothetical protein